MLESNGRRGGGLTCSVLHDGVGRHGEVPWSLVPTVLNSPVTSSLFPLPASERAGAAMPEKPQAVQLAVGTLHERSFLDVTPCVCHSVCGNYQVRVESRLGKWTTVEATAVAAARVSEEWCTTVMAAAPNWQGPSHRGPFLHRRVVDDRIVNLVPDV